MLVEPPQEDFSDVHPAVRDLVEASTYDGELIQSVLNEVAHVRKWQERSVMPNYKEMYFQLFRETEKAINILIEAQRKAEEQYMNSPEQAPYMMPMRQEQGEPSCK